jgi:hypothetical protein
VSFKLLLEALAAKPLLTRKDLARRYGRCLWTIDNWHRTGQLPAPVYLPGSRIPLWRPADLMAYERREKKR